MKIRKTVTAAKAAANKRISQESTGPKSARGKAISARNPTKYGVFAQDLLVRGESIAELETFRDEERKSYQPVGTGESGKVEIIIIAKWRLRRVYRAEAGEVNKHLADHMPAAEIAASRHSPQYKQSAERLSRLSRLEEEFDSEGHISPENMKWLRTLPYVDEVNLIARMAEIVQGTKNDRSEAAGNSDKSPQIPAEQPANEKTVAMSDEERELRELLPPALERLKVRIQSASRSITPSSF